MCGGYDQMRRGEGVRCHGFTAGGYAHCSREEYAGGIQQKSGSTLYSHRLEGSCKCGKRHGLGQVATSKAKARRSKEVDRPKVHERDYTYPDESGASLSRQQRFRFTDEAGGKTFNMQRYEDGQWMDGIKGVRRVLYGLDKLRRLPPGSTVYVPEGEKNVETCWARGLNATTSPMGAGNFLPEYAESLRGFHVILLEDNDSKGYRHVEIEASLLYGLAASIRIIDFRDERDGYDIDDFFDDGNELEALEILVENKIPWKPAQPERDDDNDEAVRTPFPEIVWQGLLGEYRDLVGPTTEAPDVFHFWMAALGLAAILGRRIFVYHAGRLYANLYVCLVGASGWARKDTAWNRLKRVLDDLFVKDEPGDGDWLKIAYGTASWEGFITDVASSKSVKSVILRLPEFASLLKTGKRDGTANLLPELTQLYDCPPVAEQKTRQHPVEWKEPFLNLATASTKKWLADSLSELLILGGFGNRYVYPLGTMKAPTANPPPMDKQAFADLLKEINEVREWVKERGPDQRQLTIDSDAEELFAEWYELFALQASGEGIIPSLAVRLQEYAWKLALLYAVCEKSDVITREHLEPALAVVDWQRESNRAIFSDFLGNNKEIEGRIVSRLEQAEGRTRLDRDMYKSLKISADRLARIYQGLENVGIVRAIDPDGKKAHMLIG